MAMQRYPKSGVRVDKGLRVRALRQSAGSATYPAYRTSFCCATKQLLSTQLSTYIHTPHLTQF